MTRTWVLAVAVMPVLACKVGEVDDDAIGLEEEGMGVDCEGEASGDGDGDGDGEGETGEAATGGDPVSCLEHSDIDACASAGCEWQPVTRITSAEPACAVEQTQMCIPPASDGGDPACLSSIPGCPEIEGNAPGPFQPAWIEHPDGGWVVIDLCGNLEYDSFTKCASGVGDAQPACDCACSI